jgi:RND family efflux transporter MFP subunit
MKNQQCSFQRNATMNRELQSSRDKTTMVLALPLSAKQLVSDHSIEMTNDPSQAEAKVASRFQLRTFAWVGAFLALLGTGAVYRFQSVSESAEIASPSQLHVRRVNVTMPELARASEFVLPATIQAYEATDLFARANGFLKVWHVDIGAKVKAGQVLAEIETPELDQELAQTVALLKQGKAEHQQAVAELEEAKADISLAEANIAKAKANAEFAISVSNRSTVLWGSRSIAREEYESTIRERDARKAELESARAELTRRTANLGTRQAIIGSREAIVANREANVQRLRDLTGFQKITAPFAGIVTRRNAEVGMLVSTGSNTGTRPLFSVARVDVLRIQAAVPQSSALGIKPGDSAQVSIPELPGQSFPAKVARTAGAADPSSRSLLVEVELPNHEGRILPGVYAQIRFRAATGQARWNIPANTLLMRNNGPHVVVLDLDNTLRTQKVTLGRDSGSAVEVLVGLEGRERLVVNPSDDLRDGQNVQVAEK